MKSPDPFKKELHPDAQVWKEEHDKLIEKTKQQQEIIHSLKIKLQNMVYYANQLEEASDKLWLKSFKVATVEAESILKELE